MMRTTSLFICPRGRTIPDQVWNDIGGGSLGQAGLKPTGVQGWRPPLSFNMGLLHVMLSVMLQ